MSSQTDKRPEISVVMPAYNAERFLAPAIKSILDQSFKDFEFIIINDGSTDKTEGIIKSFDDPRIVYIDNGENIGLSRSFNRGIAAARGRYIARMDADDVSKPERFEKEHGFLEKHPEIGVIGSAVTQTDENLNPKHVLTRAKDHLMVKWGSLFSTPLYHPTVMAHTDIMKSNPYDESLTNSEDYELWSRLLFKTDTRFANLPEPLLFYRVSPSSFTRTLNLDKRALSAYNTLSNIGRYVELSPNERSAVVAMKQERPLSFSQLISILSIYSKAASNFIRMERPGATLAMHIYLKVLGLARFLTKYKLKSLYYSLRRGR